MTADTGCPHLEGAYWFGEGVLPILEQRGLWKNPAPARYRGGAVPFAAAGARQGRSEAAS